MAEGPSLVEEREAMGRRGWEDVKKHRGIRTLAERLEKVVKEVVQSG